MRDKRQRKKGGFSLLEVLVAVAILAITFLSLMNFHGQSLVVAGRSERLSLGVFLAQAKMGELLIGLEREMAEGLIPDDKHEEGRFEKPYEPYGWKWAVRKVEIPVPESEGGTPMEIMFKAVADQIAKSVREVRLTVSWEELGKEKSFDVVTHVTKL